jgi:hypothetical protein
MSRKLPLKRNNIFLPPTPGVMSKALSKAIDDLEAKERKHLPTMKVEYMFTTISGNFCTTCGRNIRDSIHDVIKEDPSLRPLDSEQSSDKVDIDEAL